MKHLIFCIALVAGGMAYAQKIKVANGFISDSVKIGQPVYFFLSAQNPSSLNIIFPDSSFNFSPFEFLQKKYFITRTINQTSYDSAVYELITFEIAEKFFLALPVYQLRHNDTTVYYAQADTIALQSVIKDLPPDTIPLPELPLKTNTEQQEVSANFNYILTGIIIVALLVVSFVIWKLFGRRIKNYLMVRRLKKNYNRFNAEFDKLLNELRMDFHTATAEAAAALWKKYVESLTGKPLTRLTTKEIQELLKDDAVSDSLRKIDRSIYGFEHIAAEPLESLKKQANRFFNEKLQQFTHG